MPCSQAAVRSVTTARRGHDEGHGAGAHEQPVVGRRVDVHALEDASEQADPDHAGGAPRG